MNKQVKTLLFYIGLPALAVVFMCAGRNQYFNSSAANAAASVIGKLMVAGTYVSLVITKDKFRKASKVG